VFLGSPGSLVAGAVFTALLAVVVRADIAARRIPNGVVVACLVAGLGAAATVLRQPVGVRGALAGLALGLSTWLPFWMVRVLGAGDVKLAAAVGAWLGPLGVIQASALAALAGGLLALVVLARRRRLGRLAAAAALWAGAVQRGQFTRPLASDEAELLPYGVALAAGAALAGWLPAAWLPF
jgi:prepilin peptidase CpaA